MVGLDVVQMLLTLSARNDADGNVIGVVGVGQDITDRQKTEAELSRLAGMPT